MQYFKHDVDFKGHKIINAVLEGSDLDLPIATEEELGAIKVGDNLVIGGDGKLSAIPYELPIASDSELGGIKVGDLLSIDADGKLDVVLPELPIATDSSVGVVKIGDNLSVEADGTLKADVSINSVSDAIDAAIEPFKVKDINITPTDGQIHLEKDENGVISVVAVASDGQVNDERFITGGLVATLLQGKANTEHTHSIDNVENLQEALDGKANAVHNHTMEQIDGLNDALLGKSNIDHTHTFNELTNKPTSISGYGIEDAYTKSEIDGKIAGALHFKGIVDLLAELPLAGNTIGDFWIVREKTAEYVWKKEEPSGLINNWEELGPIVDLSYLKVSDVNTTPTDGGIALTLNNGAVGVSATAGDVAVGGNGFVTATNVKSALDLKVDKIEGKQLSTEDFTTELKSKLDGIDVEANKYELPIASDIILGGIRLGSNVSVNPDGKLSADVSSQDVQDVRDYIDNGFLVKDVDNTPKKGINLDLVDNGVITINAEEGAIADGEEKFISGGAIFNYAAEKQHNHSMSEVDGLDDAFDAKVDKEEGKGLSTNDFTDELKAKVEETPFIKLTHTELVSKINAGELREGVQYQITDFVTTVNSAAYPNAEAANGIQFDIIVTATGTNSVSETAKAVKHSGNTYFAKSNLSAWELKYSVKNDAHNYSWADTVNGKGVIYWMKDEFDNEAPYDFKSIKFKRYKAYSTSVLGNEYDNRYAAIKDGHQWEISCNENETDFISYFTFSFNDGSQTIYDASLNDSAWFTTLNAYDICRSNKIEPYFNNGKKVRELNDIVFVSYRSNSNVTLPFGNKFGTDCQNISFIGNGYDNKFGCHCHDITSGALSVENIFGNKVESVTFIGNYNTFGSKISQCVFEKLNYCTIGNDVKLCEWNSYYESCEIENGVKECSLIASIAAASELTPIKNVSLHKGLKQTTLDVEDEINADYSIDFFALNSIRKDAEG